MLSQTSSPPVSVLPLDRVRRGIPGIGRTSRSLARLLAMGLPVPPAFVVTQAASNADREAVLAQVHALVERLQRRAGRPLTFVVRSDSQEGVAPRAPTFDLDTPAALAAELRARWADASSTALIVQRQVAVDAGGASGSGVVFTRDPVTGSPGGYGRYAVGVPGSAWRQEVRGAPLYTLRDAAPAAWEALETALPIVETGFGDMCEVRFTVEAGQLWILQARPGRRRPAAEVRIAVDLVDEGLIAVPRAFERVRIAALTRLQEPVLPHDHALEVVARGRGRSSGVATGPVFFGHRGAAGVLVTEGPVPAGHDATGVVTGTDDGLYGLVGGPPTVAIEGLRIDADGARAYVGNGLELSAGEEVTVDGGSGLVVRGTPRLVAAPLDHTVARFLDFCDGHARGRVEVTHDVGRDTVVIDLPDEDDPDALQTAVQQAVVDGAVRLALRLPARPLLADPHPPLGPWCAVIPGDDMTWPAQLVAARLAGRRDVDPA